MRGASHRRLGQYLAERYMTDVSPICRKAFQFGCIEPDRNPVTYLKGSLRCQWMRGHNYRNARRFMKRISQRLENKDQLNLYDYYTLGKLIHYITDAFTYAHNESFPTDLADHKRYEDALQQHFLEYMAQDPDVDTMVTRSIMSAVYSYHQDYELMEANIYNDTKFALQVCCCVIALLFVKPIL